MPTISTQPLSLTVSWRPWLATGVGEEASSRLAPALEPQANVNSAHDVIAIEQ